MNRFKSIDSLISGKNLTKDEFNLFGELIEDARQRKTLQNAYAGELCDKEMTLKESFYKLAEIMENLADEVEQIAKNMETALLIETPESSFHRE